MPKQTGSETQILIDFCSILMPSWPPKTEPRRSKIDVEMPSKFDTSLKASWNTIFSAKKRQEARGPPAGLPFWSRPGGMRRSPGED